ncbi:FtsW/RodA/SpoVE family cell cycle protein [Geosporobacter ferrireducens]|uniref:Cell division protein n=1 Tax=Geosporobacter ferrireducens TaxID=1424294 RepID=A0A1D8GEE8_9FIRM|nr:FtsW/RodA/SpoVE family cell cycle protein [Geosporobacter ferrireducens]AOT69277.1 hypothetical protein Gferi_06665 [Geosporobacter ferrireducens]MTI56960.1 FtsW/RodA/SpoVE family cell cycle protein [Geosporobacter ferrireducens]
MNKKIEAFLDEVCIHIDYKAVHKDLREELGEHINDLKEENIANGYDEEKALDLAISAMGNTEEIGIKLNRQHKPQTEWSLLILTAIITIIGGIVMFSSSKFVDGRAIDFSRYIVFSAMGISTMTALYYFDYTKFKNISMPIYISGILLILVTMLIGIQVNGVKRWLVIGNFSISSPEFASVLFLIAFAGFLEKYRGKGAISIIKLIIQGAFSVFLLILMPSAATAFVLAVAYAVVLITAIMRNHFSKNKKSQFMAVFAGGAVPVILFIYSVITNPYKLKRLTVKADLSGAGYPQYMANTWLSISSWFGKTEATYNGYSLDMSLPNATGEYILVNVIATLGWAVGIVLVLLIGIFIVRMFMTTSKIKNRYGFYLSMSACTILSAQFLISILINFNLFPLASVNMPFVSYAGTGYVINMALVGIILSVWRRNNLISYKENVLNKPFKKDIVSFSDGKLIIDLKAWKQQ